MKRVKNALIVAQGWTAFAMATINPMMYSKMMKTISTQVCTIGMWSDTVLAAILAWLLANKSVRERVIQKHIYTLLFVDILLYVILVLYSVHFNNPSARYIGNHLLSGSTSYLVYEAISIMVKKSFIGEELISVEQNVKKWMSLGALFGGALGIFISIQWDLSLNCLMLLNMTNAIIFAGADYIIIKTLKRKLETV